MRTVPLVSVIILNYNGGDFLKRCVESVINTEYENFEIILVDNCSTDGSLEDVISQFGHDAKLHVVKNSLNLGFAEGNNIGLRHAKGAYIVLLNNDTEVEKDWLKEAIKVAGSDEKIAIVQSKLFFLHDRETLESAGSYIDRCGFGFERGFVKSKDLYKSVDEVFYANGAAVTIKRSTIEKTNYNRIFSIFDPDYFFAYEDVDLCWRMKLAGYKTVVAPNSIVYHQRSKTTSRAKEKLVFHHCKNRVMTLIKNYSLRNLLVYLPILITLELNRAADHLMKGRSITTLAILRAIVWNVKEFRRNWNKHLLVQYKIRKLRDGEVMKLMRNVNPANLMFNQRFYEDFSKKTGVDIVR